jgi:arylformamidase
MRVYDISVGISAELPVWPGDPAVRLERVSHIAEGANANVSHLACGVHVGTHVDAPVHFIDGQSGVEDLSLRVLNGRAYVVHLPKVDLIGVEALERANIPARTRRVLFKTRNSKLWERGETEFQEDFVGIDAGGAAWLVKKGVQLVGVDYLSVAPFGNSREPHKIFLEAGVVIVEGLDLSAVRPGRYSLHCLPLKLLGSDGAPARAILIGV